MAHPYKAHSEAKVAKAKASQRVQARASGGAVKKMTGGAETGVGRLEKAKRRAVRK